MQARRSGDAQYAAAAQTSAPFDLEWEEWDGEMPFWKHALAGSCAGVMEHCGMFPLDTVKTRMQALRPGAVAPSGAAALTSQALRPAFSDVLREIIGNQGARGFMRGCGAVAAATVPAHVALFTTYELTKRRLLDGRDHDPVRAAVCGGVSQFSHDLFLTPGDVVKQRMQLGCYSSITGCLQGILQREGVAALFRSMPTTLVMNVPFGSVLVASNLSLKHYMGVEETSDGRALSPLCFVSAGAAGGIAAAATQPLDVIKTRLQTQDCLAHDTRATATPSAHLRPKYDGFAATFKTILREEGPRAFFSGLAPRVLYTMPAAALCWGTYDTVKALVMR